MNRQTLQNTFMNMKNLPAGMLRQVEKYGLIALLTLSLSLQACDDTNQQTKQYPQGTVWTDEELAQYDQRLKNRLEKGATNKDTDSIKMKKYTKDQEYIKYLNKKIREGAKRNGLEVN